MAEKNEENENKGGVPEWVESLQKSVDKLTEALTKPQEQEQEQEQSKEEPIKPAECLEEKCKAGSVSFVPSVAGLIIAGEVVKDIIK